MSILKTISCPVRQREGKSGQKSVKNPIVLCHCLCDELSALYISHEVVSGICLFFQGLWGYPEAALEYAEDSNMLSAIVSYAKQADVGIEDMTFEVGNEELSQSELYTGNLPEGSGLFCG